jgi:large-conductance mechanosensitive channel
MYRLPLWNANDWAPHYASLAEAKAAGAATLNYRVFINTILDFVVVAFEAPTPARERAMPR